MITVEQIDLSQQLIAQPRNAHIIAENHFGVAEHSRKLPDMLTHGLHVCKGITIYNPEQQRGLLAHLAMTRDVEKSLGIIVDGYDDDLESSEVHIVQTHIGDPDYWPSMESITSFFLNLNPRSLTTSDNPRNKWLRSIALNLEDGTVSEIGSPIVSRRIKREQTVISQPIRAAG